MISSIKSGHSDGKGQQWLEEFGPWSTMEVEKVTKSLKEIDPSVMKQLFPGCGVIAADEKIHSWKDV